ncbi:hypothetical protein FQN50_009752 [Emmonsiellopsis sp. PD_5]|nr:hypothetical protein FQN50_009752 [Emmonsiellopsis sp. PD_5]
MLSSLTDRRSNWNGLRLAEFKIKISAVNKGPRIEVFLLVALKVIYGLSVLAKIQLDLVSEDDLHASGEVFSGTVRKLYDQCAAVGFKVTVRFHTWDKVILTLTGMVTGEHWYQPEALLQIMWVANANGLGWTWRLSSSEGGREWCF